MGSWANRDSVHRLRETLGNIGFHHFSFFQGAHSGPLHRDSTGLHLVLLECVDSHHDGALFRLFSDADLYIPGQRGVSLRKREIPALEPTLIGSMDANTKLELMRRARERFQPPHRNYLERSHRQYVLSPAWADSGVDPEGHRRATAKYG